MALSTPTVLANIESADSLSSLATASFAVNSGDLIIVTANVGSTSDHTALTISDTLGTLTWTKHQEARTTTSNFWRLVVWTAQATSTTSGTVTVGTDEGSRWNIHVAKVTGHNTSSPVTQSAKTEGGTATTLTVTLSGSPAATSMVYGAVGSEGETDGVTAGTGFTELQDTTSGAAAESRQQTQYDLTSADTTCDWSSLATTANGGVAIEIAEASTAVSISPGLGSQPLTGRTMTIGWSIGMPDVP